MNKKYIAIGIIILVLGYIVYTYTQSTALPPPGTPVAPPASVPPTSLSPGASSPAPVSTPAAVSAQDPTIITPVLISGNAATFTPGLPSASATNMQQTVGGGSSLDGYPSGFVSFFNSCGPMNQAAIMSAQTGVTDPGVLLIDKIVNGNLWGDPSVSVDWNNLVAAWGLPINGTFSSFTGKPGRKNVRAIR